LQIGNHAIWKLPLLQTSDSISKIVLGKRLLVVKLLEESNVFIFINQSLQCQFLFNAYICQVCIDERRDFVVLLHSMNHGFGQPLHISVFDRNGLKISSFPILKNVNMYGHRILLVNSDGHIVMRTGSQKTTFITTVDIFSIFGELIHTFNHDISFIEDFDIGPHDELYMAATYLNKIYEIDKNGVISRVFQLNVTFQKILCDGLGNLCLFDRSTIHVFSSKGISRGVLKINTDYTASIEACSISECGHISYIIDDTLY